CLPHRALPSFPTRRSSDLRCGRACPRWFSIKEGIHLRNAVDRHAPVHSCDEVLVDHGGAVVAVAYVNRYDARVGLQRQGTGNVRERIVNQPGYTVVVRLTRVHLITRGAGTRWLATGCEAPRISVHGGEVSRSGTARANEGRAVIGVSPGVTAVR